MSDEFAERIKLARVERGLSQKELGEKAGVSRPAVSQWENGATIPDKARIEELSEILEVDTAWLSGFGERSPIRKTYSGGSSEAALMGAALLDWPMAMKATEIARGCPEFLALSAHQQADALKRIYVLGVKEPAKLNRDAVSAISLSVS